MPVRYPFVISIFRQGVPKHKSNVVIKLGRESQGRDDNRFEQFRHEATFHHHERSRLAK
jgi:hypothetical protein